MSGGGGGRIIIRRLAESEGVPPSDCAVLTEIADRTVARCSREDLFTIFAILWRLLRP